MIRCRLLLIIDFQGPKNPKRNHQKSWFFLLCVFKKKMEKKQCFHNAPQLTNAVKAFLFFVLIVFWHLYLYITPTHVVMCECVPEFRTFALNCGKKTRIVVVGFSISRQTTKKKKIVTTSSGTI